MSKILDGKIVRDAIKEELKKEVFKIKSQKKSSVVPTLSIIQLGDNPSSTSYIKQKISFGESIGVDVCLHKFNEVVSKQEIVSLIQELNQKKEVGGIIIQLPLPKHFNAQEIIDYISPNKDVDGLGSNTKFSPATARGIVSLLDYYDLEITNKNILVIGQSNLVGKPTAKILANRGGVVKTANKKTSSAELISLCQTADIVIVATGVVNLISIKHIKPSHVIIDVGITQVEGRLVGDVDFESVKEHVLAISPVPGGVGPLTVASLFQNLLGLQ